MPTIEVLQQQHPDFDRERLLDLVALYRGGKCLSERAQRFICQNEYEPDGRYLKRLGSARYFNYLGPIIDRFAAALIQVPPAISTQDESEVDEYMTEWQSNVDGLGTDLSEFARETITDALMKRRTFIAVEQPTGTAETLAEWKERGLGNIRVRELETQCVTDWGCSEESGELEWIVYHEVNRPRKSPLEKRAKVRETWTIYGVESVDVYGIEYDVGNRPGIETEVPLISRKPHALKRIPVVVFEVSHGMWLAERAHDAQVEHFTQRSALNWALKASCYAMPVFHLEDGNLPPSVGTGTGMTLGANDRVDWFAPPAAPFEVMMTSIGSCREELYRIVHQMSDGVSSSASTSARSAASKQADLIATRTILEAYAVVLRDALAKLVDLVCALRGEAAIDYTISGMDKFTEIDIADLFDSIDKANTLGMPSDTYQLKVRELMLDSLMPQLSEQSRSKIIEEISEGLAELKKRDELEAEYQQALAHAVARDTEQRQGNAKANAGGNRGGPAADAPKAKPGAPGGSQPRPAPKPGRAGGSNRAAPYP